MVRDDDLPPGAARVAGKPENRSRNLGLHQVYPEPTLSSSDSQEVDIIAIHGLEAKSPDTWIAWKEDGKPESGNVHWLRDADMLPKAIPRSRILTYDWNANYDDAASSDRFVGHANTLLDRIYIDREQTGRLEHPIIFVASCFGGLLLAQALVRAADKLHPCAERYHQILECTIGVAFLGTPFCGSWNMGSMAAETRLSVAMAADTEYTQELIQYLKQGTRESPGPLDQLVSSFIGLIHNGGYKFGRVCFYETRDTDFSAKLRRLPEHLAQGLNKTGRGHGIVVDQKSASLPGVDAVSLDVRHNMLHKFNSPENDGYKRLVSRLKGFIRTGRRKHKSRKPTLSVSRVAFVLVVVVLGLCFAIQTLQQTIHKYFRDPTERVQFRSHSVPHETVTSYTERPEVSQKIREVLSKPCDGKSGPQTLIIQGLGGSGKTQLALNYLQNHSQDYESILWIDAKDKKTVRQSFERCAQDLGLPLARETSQPLTLSESSSVRAVLRWLQDRDRHGGKWLVIMDDADDPKILKDIIPRGILGSLLVTTRDAAAGKLFNGQCDLVHLDIMTPLEANSLLLRHLEIDFLSSPRGLRDISSRIVERLGYLPLAIDHVGAYIREGRHANPTTALKQFLVNFNRNQETILRNDPSYGLAPYDKTVWTVWDTSFQAIVDNAAPDGNAALLLIFLAHLGRGNIQDQLFRMASSGFPEISQHLCSENQSFPSWLSELMVTRDRHWDDSVYRETLKPLYRYGFLQRKNGHWPGVGMHGLVQWWAKTKLKDQPWDAWVVIFASAVTHQILQGKDEQEFRSYMLPHLLAFTDAYFRDIDVCDEMKVFAGTTISRLYQAERQWKAAERLLMQVLKFSNRVLGLQHPSTLSTIEALAATYRGQGRLKDAEERQRQVMRLREKVLRPSHPQTIAATASLAVLYNAQGQWEKAESLAVYTLETCKRVLGIENPDCINVMESLAVAYQGQGQFAHAEIQQKQVAELRRKVLGPTHGDTLSATASLASIYSAQRQWEKAESVAVYTIETSKMVLGTEHPDAITAMEALAVAYWGQGRLADAQEQQKQVADLREKVLGSTHPDTLSAMASLASIYNAQGNWKEAQRLGAALTGRTRHVSPRAILPGQRNATVDRRPKITSVEPRTDYCVGEKVTFLLPGRAPHTIFYTFSGGSWTALSQDGTFKRVVETPGSFAITAFGDAEGSYRGVSNVSLDVHPIPTARISKRMGHSEAEITMTFVGTPPFEYTYIRRSDPGSAEILERGHKVLHGHSYSFRTSHSGVYEIIAIKDRFCSLSTRTRTAGGLSSWDERVTWYLSRLGQCLLFLAICLVPAIVLRMRRHHLR